eukprot:scaffold360_cov374-Pavlova_lutheri.AAC.64
MPMDLGILVLCVPCLQMGLGPPRTRIQGVHRFVMNILREVSLGDTSQTSRPTGVRLHVTSKRHVGRDSMRSDLVCGSQ